MPFVKSNNPDIIILNQNLPGRETQQQGPVGYIDVDDGCWRRNELATTFGRW